MRYGYASGFSSLRRNEIDYELISDISLAGFDFVEFPLTLLTALPASSCTQAADHLRSISLGADICCNMFPPSLRITGPKRDWNAARGYLEEAFMRIQTLGVKKVVFGSSGARNLPEGTTAEVGYAQVTEFLTELVLPFLERFDVVLAMEPIGRYEANFINILADGMRIVHAAANPRVRLLADSVHMLYESENPASLRQFSGQLEHIHICENARALPVREVSDGLNDILTTLSDIGYDRTLSFEPMPYPMDDMAMALRTVKEYFKADRLH